MKIVINSCYGGFGLSDEAYELYCDLTGQKLGEIYQSDIRRDDPMLIKVIEILGEEANGNFSELKIVEIPDDVEWIIEEYDGAEWIAEKHRTWC
jgi:hypothetical protein